MYRVLIADDDMQVRKMLSQMVDWPGMDFSTVSEVSDGQEALEYLETEGADLMLLDISMPKMNGIEVIGAVKERDLPVEIIVLSCHDEFNYVKEAMRLGASEYMLKHLLTPDVLMDEIGQAKERIEDHRDDMKVQYRKLRRKREEERLMKNELLLGVLENGTTAAFSDKRLRYFYEDLQVGNYSMVILHLEDYSRTVLKYNPDGKDILYMMISNIIREICVEYTERALVDTTRGSFVLLIDTDVLGEAEMTKKLEQLIYRLRRAFKEYLLLDFQFVFSPERIAYSQLHESYQRLQNKGSYLFYENLEVVNDRQFGYFCDTSHQVAGVRDDILTHCLAKNDAAAFETAVTSYLEALKDHSAVSAKIKSGFTQLANRLLYLYEKSDGVCDGKDVFKVMLSELQAASTVRRFDEDVTKVLGWLKGKVLSDPDSDIENVYIKKSIQYIKAHFSENISLNEVADSIHVNPTYLSNLFKNTININYVDYVKEVRIKKACDLLEHSGMGVKDVGEAVGIPNRKYFSKIFKQMVGVSPLDYRKGHL